MRSTILRASFALVLTIVLGGCASGPAPLPPPVPIVSDSTPQVGPEWTRPQIADSRQRFDGVFGAIQAAGILAERAEGQLG